MTGGEEGLPTGARDRLDRLLIELDGAYDILPTKGDRDCVLKALLPVVRELINEARADELEQAARELDQMASPTLNGDPFIRASDWAARILRDRPARDRQHRSERDCWCQPVENGIGWRHNGQDADVDEGSDGSEW